jgi:hypothetical protein
MVRMTEPTHSSTIAGWREWVRLPQAEIDWIKAKLDTGARSSALHAFDLEEFQRDDAAWVRFGIHPWQDTDLDAATVELPVHDRRVIRSSTGHTQERLVVLMDLVLLDRAVTAEVTLTNRDEMGFRMLVGREALRSGILVDAGRSFVGGRAPRPVRRRNRGRV